jgi:Protein of unknown function (DUF2961)
MNRHLACLIPLALAFTLTDARAQLDAGNPMAGLDQLKDFQSMRASSADPNWRNGNGDCRWIKPGGQLVLADLSGPGRIAHIWFTIAHQDPYYSRMMVLRMYWDGEKDPSVECPIGDFFGIGHGVDKPFDSLPVRVSSDGKGRNCYWPMPFRKSARIVVSNESDKPCDAFYYYIDWQKLKSLPADTAYFNAKYRQEFPCVMGQNYLIADIEGRGHYVGTVQSVYLTSPGWYGEGNDQFYIDGEKEPSLRGTGTEDYFCDGWGFREQAGPFYGTPLWEGYDTGDRGSAYRWHIPDPITFTKSLRVEIQHRGAQDFPDGTSTGYIERDDLMSSVAYWYQVEPHKPWPPLPKGVDRLPFREITLLKGHSAVATAKHSDGPIEEQSLGGVTDGKQLWFHPHEGNGWVEVSFDCATNMNAELTCKTVHSYDYGTWRALLDGQPVGQFDLYDSAISNGSEKLGLHNLAAGSHTLRFECVGKASKSAGYFLGFDALVVRIAAYNRPSSVDLRTLQVKK